MLFRQQIYSRCWLTKRTHQLLATMEITCITYDLYCSYLASYITFIFKHYLLGHPYIYNIIYIYINFCIYILYLHNTYEMFFRFKSSFLLLLCAACSVHCNGTSTCGQKDIYDSSLDLAIDMIVRAKYNTPTCKEKFISLSVSFLYIWNF